MSKTVDVRISDKVAHIRNILTDTSISIQLYKKLGLFSNSEVNICISSLNELHGKLSDVRKDAQQETKIAELQVIIDKLSTVLSTFGTKTVDDLLSMTFGADVNDTTSDEMNDKFKLIRKYVRPVGFKIVTAEPTITAALLCASKITDDTMRYDTATHLECFNCDPTTAVFYQKVHGVKIVIRSDKLKKVMVLNGLVDDVNIDVLENRYIKHRKRTIHKIKGDAQVLARQLEMMTLKEMLVYSDEDVGKRNASIVALSNRTRTDKLEKTIQYFTTLDIYGQRNTLIDLLTRTDDGELKYTAYLLYDVISSDSNMDSNAQMMIYESFPFQVKMYFKDAMKHTMNYSQQMTQKYDVSKLSIEQQVYALRAPDVVKDKALAKLKEIKNKSDDSNGKAKQYLDGLLKIPFNTFREEPLLRMTKVINEDFKRSFGGTKSQYTMMEVYNTLEQKTTTLLQHETPKMTKTQTDRILSQFPQITKGKTVRASADNIRAFLQTATTSERLQIASITSCEHKPSIDAILSINSQLNTFEESLSGIDKALDASVHGQLHAKKQLKKIISQWITGEQKGHCFGFEGSPGIGKTSLAKYGLSQCLKDENGKPRPFTFIALGGSCNGSTLEGHGYTYVNSMWGTIAQAVMDAECMNPIFFFDEADKTNKEHGNEINGILTHLTDYTQNDSFNDRFFTGVPFNLAKALFIFSYNNPEQIDKILLDRIHRVKFENLTIDEKVVIVNDYILPRINSDMGLGDVVQINDELIRWLIITYTSEPGVRKLKELLFDLYGEINIELMHRTPCEVPIILTQESISKHLVKYHKIIEHKIHATPQVGVINGLYANSRGGGGIIQIMASLFPANSFLELKLTGMQGEVMKESMHVAKTLAWSLCSPDIQQRLLDNEKVGIHIHTPDGATNKDGPSAGAGETVVIYSTLNNLKIDNTVAITGEVDLRGNVTAIGGLDNKIAGGLRAGVRTFIYPKENHDDFMEYKSKNPDVNATFIEVSHISEVFPLVFLSI